MLAPQAFSQKIVIIGSGVGGLTAGILLSRLGFDTVVVEKNRRPGGLMRGYRREGVDCPVGIHYLSSLGPGEPLAAIFHLLGLEEAIETERMGVSDPIDRYFFPHQEFALPGGIEAFEDGLRIGFPNEQKAIDQIMERLSPYAVQMSSLDSFFSFSRSIFFDLEPSSHFFSEIGCSPDLTATLGLSCALIGASPDVCPLWLHFSTLAAYLVSSWRLTTGSTALAERFASRYQSLGGKLILGQAVRAILVDGGKASGVVLESGESLAADAVVAAIHPKVVLSLVKPGTIKTSHLRRIQAFTESPSVFGLQILVPSSLQPALPSNYYHVDLNHPQGNQVCYFQVRETERPEWNLITAIQNNAYDDWAPWAHTRTGKREAGYQEKKQGVSRVLLSKVESILGTLPEPRIIDSFSPLTLRDWTNAPLGGAYGVGRSADQIQSTMLLSRRALDGLHMVGQSVMAPGILGSSLSVLRTLARLAGPDALAKLIKL